LSSSCSRQGECGLSPTEQEVFTSIPIEELHDVFLELASRTLVLRKKRASSLYRLCDLNVEKLNAKLKELAASIKSTLDANVELNGRVWKSIRLPERWLIVEREGEDKDTRLTPFHN